MIKELKFLENLKDGFYRLNREDFKSIFKSTTIPKKHEYVYVKIDPDLQVFFYSCEIRKNLYDMASIEKWKPIEISIRQLEKVREKGEFL